MLALEVGEADEGPVGHHHAMNCPRCSGLLVPETVHDVALSEDLLRCVNCGRMAKEGEMPKFIDEAHRERWMEGQRLAREAKKKQA